MRVQAGPSGAQDGQLCRNRNSGDCLHSVVVLDDASEEEAEELFPDTSDKSATANRESKREREEKLKKMMEDDDDVDADGLSISVHVQSRIRSRRIDEEMPDADEEPEREPTPVEQPLPPKSAELKEEVTVQGGRRRGKRQVMKKRTIKDEEGYLGKHHSAWVNPRTVLNRGSHSRGTNLGVIL